ncbi:HSP20-like chaperone [Gigaspora margarita]|uniref:HSP20-like chaperone n=1 Tax=Gigaspora margarita TaxID=4874 RepID=A0A8H4AKQ3_GIGMA|nr:HSP20-like chaperone [Gigaspora margarita]
MYLDSDLGHFENAVSRLFDGFWSDFDVAKRGGNTRANRNNNWHPLIDVHENDNEITICADLPGFTKDKVNIDVRDNALVISGKLERDEKYKEGTTHIQERRYGTFTRTLSLPSNVKAENITAKFEHGVLELKLPKSAPTGMKIAVQ